ncbi:hypothetical protein [Halorhabdus amylolytica]|uniref:hypothetical protein n=1 Tax=Halorhabdus amylolytica TaxID=2559573 RepID=UPI0010A9C7A0
MIDRLGNECLSLGYRGWSSHGRTGRRYSDRSLRRSLDAEGNGIVASNGEVHDELLDALMQDDLDS